MQRGVTQPENSLLRAMRGTWEELQDWPIQTPALSSRRGARPREASLRLMPKRVATGQGVTGASCHTTRSPARTPPARPCGTGSPTTLPEANSARHKQTPVTLT